MDFEYIVLSPKEVQNLLDCIDIIPSNHYICIKRNINTNKIYINDYGRGGNNESEDLEITKGFNKIQET